METRFYQASGLDGEGIAHNLEKILLAQGYQVQRMGNREHIVVQLRKGGDFEAVLGMQAALTVTLQTVPTGVIAIVGQQKWIDKAAAGTLGMLFFWPLIFTSGAGIVRQAQLESQLFGVLDSVIFQQRPGVQVGPLPPHLHSYMPPQGPPPPFSNVPSSSASNISTGPQQQPQNTPGPGQIQCFNCQQINEAEDFYCSHCGKPLALHKKRCPQCKAEIKSSADFCTKCGTAVSQ